ncbi:MAG: chemotaxis protein CheB [Prosthecobacter sp.]
MSKIDAAAHAEFAGLPTTAPDFIEQDYPEEIDNIIPSRGYQMMPMVGLGGSAGSITALQEFFKAMPENNGMVFVVILHLARARESSLAELLARSTTMPVVQAEDGQRVHANHVYVIPPGKELATVDGHLRLSELKVELGKRVVVDLFFRSLADTHGPHSAAVILSGADGDGALGIKRIKERGGLTISQDPEEAEHSGMPVSAIDTGMVDWVLPIAQMPQRLLNYFHQEKSLKLPPEEGPQPAQTVKPSHDQAESALREVLVYLRTRTGRDFSYYKRATILRRIARRMQVNDVDHLPAYLVYLRTHPGESGALLQDLLISVTNFFRDRDAFAALEAHIPQLFEGKAPGDSVRVWVPACATGEEAYSIAMLLLEHARKLDTPPTLQVFACDLDEEAISHARAGLYPEAMVADVSDDRIRKFFVKDHRGYRVRRELREMMLFAAHDLLKDAPFSRMDLISCRNLLIYLNRGAQKRVFDTFHFAMKPGGLLFLGSSESIEDGSALFRVIDKKFRLYGHQPASRVGLPVPSGPSSLLRAIEMQERASTNPVVHGRRFAQDALLGLAPSAPALDRISLAEFHFKLVERLAPPSVIVNADHEIVHLSENAGRFLKFVGGEPTSNILRVVDPMIRVELRAGLFRATETNAVVNLIDLPMQMEGQARLLDIRITPAPEIAAGFLLIIFEMHSSGSAAQALAAGETQPPAEPLIRQLERELEQVKGHLRDTVEQYEASTEEMKASNEELQAMNEELRSATEELETSREELQSINEELTTVNAEMKSKVEELANANSDLQNLMASTAIATVFLDRELAITRYTPSAVELFHLIPTDIGRPLEHLKNRLDYPELITDAERVLRNLVPVDREVREESRWFLARLQPYRTVEDHIAGVVLTFVDITERRLSAVALHEQMEELTRFNAVAVGRETRMIELKKEINELLLRLGEPPRYKLAADLEGEES